MQTLPFLVTINALALPRTVVWRYLWFVAVASLLTRLSDGRGKHQISSSA